MSHTVRDIVAVLRERVWLAPVSADELNHRDQWLADELEAAVSAWQPTDEAHHERLVALLDDELSYLVSYQESGRQDWVDETQANIDALKRAMELWPSPPAPPQAEP